MWKELAPAQLDRLPNKTCIYCKRLFDANRRRTQEHVIGRRFVPKGSLAAQWNLVAWACEACNAEKCRLENDLSAITLRPGLLGDLDSDQRILDEARRKESARSHRTGEAVRDSSEEFDLTFQIAPGFTMTAKMQCGPQFERRRAFRLAWFHISAFFYRMTFREDEGRGSWIPGVFAPITVAARNDWGNPQMVGFQNLTSDWTHHFYAVGADGYFKVSIRRRIAGIDPPLWAWALEWNRTHRLIGFCGDDEGAQTSFDRVPLLEKRVVKRTTESTATMRFEVPLEDANDRLFAPPETA